MSQSPAVKKQLRALREGDPVMSRRAWAGVLIGAGTFALAVALILQKMGLGFGSIRPLPFVGTVVAVKLAFFAFWPALKKRGEAVPVLGEVFVGKRAADRDEAVSVNLWDSSAVRVQAALFAANVPTFILSADQRIIDWNAAFVLVFGDALKRGSHVSDWYALLDNFRRVPKRTEKLYGEGILPITDRERAVYASAAFGRIVFTKIMSPMVDLRTGRIVGWTIVLNINSVHERLAFFTALYDTIALESKKIRYSASYDRLFDRFAPRRHLLEQVVTALAPAHRILELGCGSGKLTAALLSEGHRVTAVEEDTYLLRRARERCRPFAKQRLVRQGLDQLSGLQAAHYDGALLFFQVQLVQDPVALLGKIAAALRPGGILVVAYRADGSTFDSLFEALCQSLERSQAFDELKHQFNHVWEFARMQEARRAAGPVCDGSLLRTTLASLGLTITSEAPNLEDGHSLLLIARKKASS